MTSFVVPGQVVGRTATHRAGEGTHVYGDKVVASIVGELVTQTKTGDLKVVVSVPRTTKPTLPKVGSVVLCRVTRVQQRQLTASVLLLGNIRDSSDDIISYPSGVDDDLQFQAVLRREDVRTHEKDRVVMDELYRVGDVIRAAVVSLGDERNYYVSTAGNDFGVVVATSESGHAMVPASWRAMTDVVTGGQETRKVAKPS